MGFLFSSWLSSTNLGCSSYGSKMSRELSVVCRLLRPLWVQLSSCAMHPGTCRRCKNKLRYLLLQLTTVTISTDWTSTWTVGAFSFQKPRILVCSSWGWGSVWETPNYTNTETKDFWIEPTWHDADTPQYEVPVIQSVFIHGNVWQMKLSFNLLSVHVCFSFALSSLWRW